MMINGFADKDNQFNFNGKLYAVKKGRYDTKYFRYNYPNSILLDNVTVSYNKKKGADNQPYSVDYSKYDACKFIS